MCQVDIMNFSLNVEIFQEWAQQMSEIFFNARRETYYNQAAM